MNETTSLLLALTLSAVSGFAAPVRITDPKSFVSGVYRHIVAAQTNHHDYAPPTNIYTARLEQLIRDDRKRAKGEVGCLDFDFWVNGQDWTITNLVISQFDISQSQKAVVAKFKNFGDPEEIHFDFLRINGLWLLDDVRSAKTSQWTLSKILKCSQ